MIRILLVDDHPALRTGLHTVIRSEPGLIPVGAAAGEHDLWPLLNRTRPDVVLLDYHLPEHDGFVLCHRIKAMLPPPKVLIYSAYADASLTVPAIVSGADGVINKGAPAHELFDAIRTVADGEKVLPPVSPAVLAQAEAELEPEDHPIMRRLVEQRSRADIAAELDLDLRALNDRVEAIIDRLRIAVPGSILDSGRA